MTHKFTRLQLIERAIVVTKRLIVARGINADCTDLETKLGALKTAAEAFRRRQQAKDGLHGQT